MSRRASGKKHVHFASARQSNEANAETEPNAESDSSSTTGDFLGRPPSHTEVNFERDSSSTSEDFLGRPPSHTPTSEEEEIEVSGTDQSASETSSSAPGKTSGRNPARKQTNPVRRTNHYQREIANLQKTTNLLIPRLPFQRYVGCEGKN